MAKKKSALIHPSDVLKQEWLQQRRSIQNEGLIVEHSIQSPDAIECTPMSHHVLVVQLTKGMRQVTRFNGTEYDGEFHRGEFFLQPAYLSGFSSWETTDEALVLIVKPEFLTKVAIETECINPSKIEVKDIVKGYCPHLKKIAYSFVRELQTGGLGGKLYTDCLANQLAISLLRHHCVFDANFEKIKGGLSPYQKRQVIDYIQANLTEELGLQDISKLIGISQFHFSREFKKSLGLTPHQYVRQQRVEKAKELLKQPDITLADIAVDCGFTHQSHMGRVFKEYVGTTPKKYRRSLE